MNEPPPPPAGKPYLSSGRVTKPSSTFFGSSSPKGICPLTFYGPGLVMLWPSNYLVSFLNLVLIPKHSPPPPHAAVSPNFSSEPETLKTGIRGNLEVGTGKQLSTEPMERVANFRCPTPPSPTLGQMARGPLPLPQVLRIPETYLP